MIGANKEKRILSKILKLINLPIDAKIIDVGCGYGRILRFLKENGYNPIGVDVNEDIIKINNQNGLKTISVSDLKKKKNYDLIIISHVIEHLPPNELLNFLDFYLDFLKNDGYLIILSPVFTKQFYVDFDHIKPYSPLGINSIFNIKKQVQYYSRNKIFNKEVFYCKVPYNHRLLSYELQTKGVVMQGVIDIFLLIIYILSFTFIKKTVSWIALYIKK
jgi:SAM-dependent methyltransferase